MVAIFLWARLRDGTRTLLAPSLSMRLPRHPPASATMQKQATSKCLLLVQTSVPLIYNILAEDYPQSGQNIACHPQIAKRNVIVGESQRLASDDKIRRGEEHPNNCMSRQRYPGW